MLKELLSYGQNWTLQAVEKGGENLYLMILAFSDLEFEVKGILGGGAREDVLLDIGRARRSQQAGPAGESIQRAEQTLRFFSFFFFFLLWPGRRPLSIQTVPAWLWGPPGAGDASE
jgi:hypothetical protein